LEDKSAKVHEGETKVWSR